jgi:hypothetical protein
MIKSDIHVSHMLNSGETQGNVIADKRIETRAVLRERFVEVFREPSWQ